MNTEEYIELWQEAIRLCELETNEEEASSFVRRYYNRSSIFFFSSMDDRTLLLTFVGLVVYEKKFHLQYGSTSPAIFCYRALLNKANLKEMNKKFIFDIGDWAADYSDNGYVPMGSYRGYGPRKYYKFLEEYQTRVSEEKAAAQKRKEERLAEGREKALATKRKHQERKEIIQQLRDKTVDESLSIIKQSGKSVFYYIDLIEEWFQKKTLSEEQKEDVLSLFPCKSTRHNNRRKKNLEKLI